MMALYILMGVVLMGVVGVLSAVIIIRLGDVMESIQSIPRLNQEIVTELHRLAEGQRLSMVFAISPQSLTIDPADFEPQRPVIRERLMKAFETETHPDPGTLAYCILDHSGWNEFVDGKTFQDAQKALGRLLANKNTKAAKKFLGTLVDQL